MPRIHLAGKTQHIGILDISTTQGSDMHLIMLQKQHLVVHSVQGDILPDRGHPVLLYKRVTGFLIYFARHTAPDHVLTVHCRS
jgi:hypothetical protein